VGIELCAQGRRHGTTLSRILATEAFRRSPSLGRFLKYLVNQALAGWPGKAPKEYRLGVDVFDRGDDFDPSDDNIVRVQARKPAGAPG